VTPLDVVYLSLWSIESIDPPSSCPPTHTQTAHVKALGGFALQCRDSLHEALVASWVALQAWWRVIVLLGRPVLRLCLHLWRLGK
jgi:hypothetical protein